MKVILLTFIPSTELAVSAICCITRFVAEADSNEADGLFDPKANVIDPVLEIENRPPETGAPLGMTELDDVSPVAVISTLD